MINFFAVVVLYNTFVNDSITINNLKKIHSHSVDIIVVDNSTKDFNNEKETKANNWTYLSMNGNAGLSKAYNRALDYLKDEDIILSLSTKEYEKMISHKMIQLDFVIRRGHTFKRNAVYLKKARGMMLNYLIEHHIEDIKQIKEIVIDDYHFSENDSNDDHWVFIKNEKMKYIKK